MRAFLGGLISKFTGIATGAIATAAGFIGAGYTWPQNLMTDTWSAVTKSQASASQAGSLQGFFHFLANFAHIINQISKAWFGVEVLPGLQKFGETGLRNPYNPTESTANSIDNEILKPAQALAASYPTMTNTTLGAIAGGATVGVTGRILGAGAGALGRSSLMSRAAPRVLSALGHVSRHGGKWGLIAGGLIGAGVGFFSSNANAGEATLDTIADNVTAGPAPGAGGSGGGGGGPTFTVSAEEAAAANPDFITSATNFAKGTWDELTSADTYTLENAGTIAHATLHGVADGGAQILGLAGQAADGIDWAFGKVAAWAGIDTGYADRDISGAVYDSAMSVVDSTIGRPDIENNHLAQIFNCAGSFVLPGGVAAKAASRVNRAFNISSKWGQFATDSGTRLSLVAAAPAPAGP